MGSPRLITNENGAVTKRQDFGAFGDETLTAARASGLGYTSTDELRQDYTGYQKDNESGLEYAQARYYNTAHGRFTSVDPLTASATIRDPQSFNRYSYVLNSPYKFTDPLGLLPWTSGTACAQWCQNSDGGSGGGLASTRYNDSWYGLTCPGLFECEEFVTGGRIVEDDDDEKPIIKVKVPLGPEECQNNVCFQAFATVTIELIADQNLTEDSETKIVDVDAVRRTVPAADPNQLKIDPLLYITKWFATFSANISTSLEGYSYEVEITANSSESRDRALTGVQSIGTQLTVPVGTFHVQSSTSGIGFQNDLPNRSMERIGAFKLLDPQGKLVGKINFVATYRLVDGVAKLSIRLNK